MFTIQEFTTDIQTLHKTSTFFSSDLDVATSPAGSTYRSARGYADETFASVGNTYRDTINGDFGGTSSSETQARYSSTIVLAGGNLIFQENRLAGNSQGYGETNNHIHITDTWWPSDNSRIFQSYRNVVGAVRRELLVQQGLISKYTSVHYASQQAQNNYYLASHQWVEFNDFGGYTIVDSTVAGGGVTNYSFSASYITNHNSRYTYESDNGVVTSYSTMAFGGAALVYGLVVTTKNTYSINGNFYYIGTRQENVNIDGINFPVTVNDTLVQTFNTSILTYKTTIEDTTEVFQVIASNGTTEFEVLTFNTITTATSELQSSTIMVTVFSYFDVYNNSAAWIGIDTVNGIACNTNEIIYYSNAPDAGINLVNFRVENYLTTDKLLFTSAYGELFNIPSASYSFIPVIVPTTIDTYVSSNTTLNITKVSSALRNTAISYLTFGLTAGPEFPGTETFRNLYYYTYQDTTNLLTHVLRTSAVTYGVIDSTMTIRDYILNNFTIYNVDENDQLVLLDYNQYIPVTRTVNCKTRSPLEMIGYPQMGGTMIIPKAVSQTVFNSSLIESFPLRVFGYRDFNNGDYQSGPQLLGNKRFPFSTYLNNRRQSMFTVYPGSFTTHYIVDSANLSNIIFKPFASVTVSAEQRSISATTEYTQTLLQTSNTVTISFSDSYLYLENGVQEPFAVTMRTPESNNTSSQANYQGTNSSKIDSAVYNIFGLVRYCDLVNGELDTTSICDTVNISFSSDISDKSIHIKDITYTFLTSYVFGGSAGANFYFTSNRTYDVDFL